MSPRDEQAASTPEPPRRWPSRKLTLPSRLRASVWSVVHRVLGFDALWSCAFVITIALVLGVQGCGTTYERFLVGARAPADIKALQDFEFIDVRTTDTQRREAEEAVLEIYDHDTERGTRHGRQLGRLFELGRSTIKDASLAGEDGIVAATRLMADRIPPRALRVLAERRFHVDLEREIATALQSVLTRMVVTNRAILKRANAVTLRRLPGENTAVVTQFDEFLDHEEARRHVREALAAGLDLPREAEKALIDWAESFVDANVSLNAVATDRERTAAGLAVRSVIHRVKQGDILARSGDPLTQDVIDTIDAARRQARTRLDISGLLGLLFIASTFAFFLFRYSRFHQRHFRKMEHLHALMVLMTISMLALSSALMWLAREVADNLAYPFNQVDLYTFLIPLGAGAILVALLANGRIATVYAGFSAALFGAANDWSAYLMIWALLVQCAGIYAISTYRERAAFLKAGLIVGGAGAITTLALEAMMPQSESLAHDLFGAGLAFVGGAIGVGLVISFTLPMLERLFNVLTDIRLLELSNVNHPLLADLAVRAPGSYNHSLVVGTLAEEAARAIGANSLFCRVAAFYHDIGKMNKAEYFVENQRGVNPHDRLSPSMSALIITAHVKDGIKLAREAGLPEQIVDIIPQHHGTKLMTYFYEKAKNQNDPTLGPVKEEDFRYPGPKPQTREAAIFMLADSVEAAARTVEDPTAKRMQEMIHKITSSIVLVDQLDECDLTFADLEKIQQAFLRSLVGMYHHRVDYPGFDFSAGKGQSRPAESSPRKGAAALRSPRVG